MINSLDITIDSFEGVTEVEIRNIDDDKGVECLCHGDKIIQYRFDLGNKDAQWTPETATAYIKARANKRVSSVLQASLGSSEGVKQSVLASEYVSSEVMTRLKGVDPDPFFAPLRINHGVGSNKQSFNRAFWDKAGAKFEGTPFFVNHSDLSEFGNANPIGSIVKYVGADDEAATLIAYVSASEGTYRQKIKESQALGDKGFVMKVSIEGIPVRADFTIDEKTGIRHFHDLAIPTGIAIVNKEGLKGSQITL